MAKVEKLSVALTPDMATMLREAVESGDYASASEVVRDALREWKLRRGMREREVEELRRLWDEGLASGPPVDGESAFARLRARLDSAAANTKSK
jgi:antitoxin ParD1/3/4